MKLFKNYAAHNLVGHPLSEVVYWVVRPFGADLAREAAGKVHDFFLPPVRNDHGRG